MALEALAAATQARGQMHLRCSGKGLQLQEGKGSLSFSLAGSKGMTWSRAHPFPYLPWEHRLGEVDLFTWVPWSTRSYPHRGLASRSQKAVALGRGPGPQLRGGGDWLRGDSPALASLSRELQPSHCPGALM